jgi:hypothetical protein
LYIPVLLNFYENLLTIQVHHFSSSALRIFSIPDSESIFLSKPRRFTTEPRFLDGSQASSVRPSLRATCAYTKHWWGKYWQGKSVILGEKLIPVPRCPPQNSQELTWD